MGAWRVLLCLTVGVHFVSRVLEASIYSQHTAVLQPNSPGSSATRLHGTFTWCGDGKCKCSGSYADCSKQGANLTYIPELPSNIRFLNFTYNCAVIDHDDFFRNVTGIDHLEIGNNNLRYISPGAFRILKNLTILDLGHNNLTYAALAPALSVKTLRKLVIIALGLGPLPDDLFRKYPMPRLQELLLYENQISRVNMSDFVPLVNLKVLVLGSNKMYEIQTAYLPSLETLGLDDCGLPVFPRSCGDNVSLLPRLETLYIRQNFISSLSEDICLPALKTLDLSSNQISNLVSGMFNEHLFPSLTYLGLSSLNLRIKRIENHVFNNSQITKLELRYNSIDFSAVTVSLDMFAGCTSLNYVDLSHNNFRDTSADSFHILFRPLSNLRHLNLGTCSIKSLKTNCFSETRTLENLDLFNNLLNTIPDGVFEQLVKLTILNLNRNQIRSVREATFSEVTRRRLQHLDLSDNPFQCDCDLMWFRQWYISEKNTFQNAWNDTYACNNLPNVSLDTFVMSEQACLFSHETYKLIVVCLVIPLSLFLLVIMLHRYRWHIRLVLYEAFRGRGDRWRRLQAEHFQYDVFVSYAEEDFHWVSQHLISELEETETRPEIVSSPAGLYPRQTHRGQYPALRGQQQEGADALLLPLRQEPLMPVRADAVSDARHGSR